MRNKLPTRLILGAASVVALVTIAYVVYMSQLPGVVTLRFSAVVNDQPATFDRFMYRNPGGDGEFKIRDFQFFVSNIKLISDNEAYHESESYHLARFGSRANAYDIVLDLVPQRRYHTIEMSVGVDKARNGSIDIVGDLDPNGRMAWTWDVGYKFILFEGGLRMQGAEYPLVYHVGFDENYKTVRFNLDEPISVPSTIDFEVDLMKLFTGTTTIDLAALPNVKFDSVDASVISENYERMISLCDAKTPDCMKVVDLAVVHPD